MQEIRDEHHEEHPLHVAILNEGPAPPAPQAKKHNTRNRTLVCIAVVALIGIGLGLGLGLGLDSGDDGSYEPITVTDANGTTFEIDPVLTRDAVLQFDKDAPNLTPELEQAATDLVDIAFQDPDYVNYLKSSLAECIREAVSNSTGGVRRLQSSRKYLQTGDEVGPYSYPGLQGAINFMLTAGQDFIDALVPPTTISSVKRFSTKGYSHIPPLLRGDLKGAVQGFVREYDQAFGTVKEKMCRGNVGQPFYGSMAVFCDEMTLGPCTDGVATLDAPRCGERWRQVIGTPKPSCAPKNGAQPTGGVYPYVCFHQDPYSEGLAFDDGPSAPAAGLYMGTRILNALSRIYFLDPKVSVSDFTQFWKFLWNVEGYVDQQQELELVRAAFMMSSLPKAFSSWVSIFWYGGVKHDNCYHHGAITYGTAKSECDSAFLSTNNAICDRVFPRNQEASWLKQREAEMLQRLLSDQYFKNKMTAPNTHTTCMAASMIFYSAVKFGGDSAWLAANTKVGNSRTYSPAFTTHRAEGCNVTLRHCAVCNTVASPPFELGDFNLECQKCEDGWALKSDMGSAVCIQVASALTVIPSTITNGIKGEEYTFDLSAAGMAAADTSISFVVTWGDGDTATVPATPVDGAVRTPVTHKWQQIGTFAMKVELLGLKSNKIDEKSVSVDITTKRPGLTIMPATVTDALAGNDVTLTLQAYDLPADTRFKFFWNWDDNSGEESSELQTADATTGSVSRQITHRYTLVGTAAVNARAEDVFGKLLGSAEATVTVKTAALTLTVDPTTVTAGTVGTAYTFTLKATGIPQAVTSVTFDYNFGDGEADSTGTAPPVPPTNGTATTTISHSYQAEGSFGLVATVKYVATPSNVVSDPAQALVTIGVSTDRNQTLNICETWTAAQSGGNGATADTWTMTGIPVGATLELSFDFFSIPDRMTVSYQGTEAFSSGWRGDPSYNGQPEYPGGVVGIGQGGATLFTKGASDSFVVTVTGGGPGTEWEYKVRCTTGPATSPSP